MIKIECFFRLDVKIELCIRNCFFSYWSSIDCKRDYVQLCCLYGAKRMLFRNQVHSYKACVLYVFVQATYRHSVEKILWSLSCLYSCLRIGIFFLYSPGFLQATEEEGWISVNSEWIWVTDPFVNVQVWNQ